MKIAYIDESGDTSPITQGGSRWLCLSAYVVDEADRANIEVGLRAIKHEFYKDSDIEFKSNFIRYANPDITKQHSPLKLHSRERYNDLEARLLEFLTTIPGAVLPVVIDKAAYWRRYPSQNPYNAAYLFLLERIDMVLRLEGSLGIVIIDPREGRVEKRFIGDTLERLHHSMRFEPGGAWNKTPRIVERLLYSDSASTIGIQIIDLFCYPIFHIFEYDKEPGEYWRFDEITRPKIFRTNGRIDSKGLKIFPETTKKGLDTL